MDLVTFYVGYITCWIQTNGVLFCSLSRFYPHWMKGKWSKCFFIVSKESIYPSSMSLRACRIGQRKNPSWAGFPVLYFFCFLVGLFCLLLFHPAVAEFSTLVKNELILYVLLLTSHKKFVSIHTGVSVILEVVRICSFETAHRFRFLLKTDLSAVRNISFTIW